MAISKLSLAGFCLLAAVAFTVPTPASYLIIPSLIFPSSSTPTPGPSTPGGNTNTGTTVTFTLTPLPTVGSVVVAGLVTVQGDAEQTQGMTDNQTPANFYSRMVIFPNGTAITTRVTLFCGVVKTSSGTFTLTGSNVTGAGSKFLVAKEYKNGTCNLDVSSAATGNTHPYSCGSMTTVNAKDILVAMLGYSFGGGGTNTFTAPTGFTLIASQTNGNVVATGSMADQIRTATGTFNGTYDGTNVGQPSVNGTTCAQIALMSH